MTSVETKWYSGLLKDYTCSLIWGSDRVRTFMLLHSLLQGCSGDIHILTHRPAAAWGRNIDTYRTINEFEKGLQKLLGRDHTRHTTFILDIGQPLTPKLQTSLAQFIETKREHNTTLIVICEDLENLGSICYRFDLVFHAVPDQPGETPYQQWINKANQDGVLITESLEWLQERNPEHLLEWAIVGTYIFTS